jgi:hypothetical protein
MNRLLAFALMSALVACGQEDRGQRTEVAVVPALPANFQAMKQMSELPGGPALYRATSLCEVMATYHDAGGVFVVEDLRSALEDDEAGGRADVPFTYAVLRSDLEWNAGAPRRLVVRQTGGALSGDVPRFVGAPVPFTVGETVVAFLRLREEENRGFYQLLEPSVFRDEGAGLTHAQWFRGEQISAADVRGYFDANTKPTFACRRNAEPTEPPGRDAPPEPDGPLTPLPDGAE